MSTLAPGTATLNPAAGAGAGDASRPGYQGTRTDVLKPARTPGYVWLAFLGIVLAGYALAGRGFAYVGFPPIFISEITLVAGLVVFCRQRRAVTVFGMPTVALIVVFIALGLFRTLPYLGEYRIDALRDGVLYGYGVFALIVAAVIVSQPELLPWFVRQYQRFAVWLMLGLPLVIGANLVLGDVMPHWPWAEVSIVGQKPGDGSVHLGGVTALAVVGLLHRKNLLWPILICLMIAVLGSLSRGGLVSWGLALMVALAAGPTSPWARRLLATATVIMLLALVLDPSVQMERDREYSARQLVANVVSIFSDEDTGDLDDTKEWRLQWWHQIIDYTVHGEYFWQGKGFGINLANDDGFQVEAGDALRSPHNGHLSVLARMGVPGFALWIGIHLAWMLTIVNGYLVARQTRKPVWGSLFILLLAYWTAVMCNATFDVYLEGPMGGLWCWTIMGVGLAAAYLQQRHPDLLDSVPCDGRADMPDMPGRAG